MYNPHEAERTRYIVSCDPGSVNFCYVTGECNLDFTNLRVVHGQVLDITVMHPTMKEAKCNLSHQKCPSSWVAHLCKEHGQVFDQAEYFFIERQPPRENASVVSIEQLLIDRYSTKVKSCNPCSIHARYGVAGRHISDLDERRVWRKQQVIKLAEPMLDKTLLDHYKHADWSSDRRQHLADATCQMMYMCEILAKEYAKSKKEHDIANKVISSKGISFKQLTEQFMFKVK